MFRFEPLIIAVECRDIEASKCLVSLAIKFGFRASDSGCYFSCLEVV